MNYLSLSELNNLVRQALELTMPDSFWVRAEISELRVAANGHCYMEFVEHDEKTGQIAAKARANCWRNVYAFLRPRFERESGQRLVAGIRVLVEVQVAFHPQYGYSLTVSDIDPSYSLGDAARRRQEILRQLEEDGVLGMNRELPLSLPLRRIAVISSESAAGYGDFCRQLEQSGLPFIFQLFPAMMQGEQVESSVIAALNQVASQMEAWDAVVIIRGGGAVTDLNGFESYALAANVAQFPLPVITGIGHERDETVIDLVAHTRLKTPTAVAAFLIDLWQGQLDALSQIEQRLYKAVQQHLAHSALALTQLDKRLMQAGSSYITRVRKQITGLNARLTTSAHAPISRQKESLARQEILLATSVRGVVQTHVHRLEVLEKSLHLADPQHVLRRGFTITRVNGRAITSASDVRPGDQLSTTLAEGTITSTV